MLASSGKQHEVEHYVELLGARELADDWTTSADVEQTNRSPTSCSRRLRRRVAGGR